MLSAGIKNIVVVLGANRKKIRPVINDLPVCIAINDRPDSHMADSVSKGLSKMPESITGIMVALCDHPLVSPKTYGALYACFYQVPDSIIVPVYNGKGGHPTIFPRSLCKSVDNGIPLNQVLHTNPHRVCRIPVNDPGVVHDMDTPADYRRILSMGGKE
jgi:molybdenum cofactor cytidylyltransferase